MREDECIDVSGWPEEKIEQLKGSREKAWLRSAERDQEYIFKESNRRYPWEFWSEIIASRIGNLLSVPVPKTYCSQRNSIYGALIESFLKYQSIIGSKWQVKEIFVEGGELIQKVHPAYKRKKGKEHNIYFVEEVFRLLHSPEKLFQEFFKVVIFDVIIGNTDRHQDNWGFIVNFEIAKKNIANIELAPAFDNSDSLGHELLEEKLVDFLKDDKKLGNYIKKGKSHIRWSEDGKNLEKVNHFQFLEKAAQKWPVIIDHIKNQTSFADEAVQNILDNLGKIKINNPQYQLTETRQRFIKKLVCSRRDLLKQQFGV